MTKKILSASALWMLLTVLTVSGCISPPPKHSFMLSAAREGTAPRAALTEKPLKVSRFRAAPQYENKGFVYRKGELDYESDYYNEFFTLPGAGISEEIRKWMVKSGIFRFVSDSPDVEGLHYLLEGSVTALYGDYTKGKTPLAVVEIRASLSLKDPDRSRMIFQKTYGGQAALAGDTPEQLVRGWNEALINILAALEADILNAGLER